MGGIRLLFTSQNTNAKSVYSTFTIVRLFLRDFPSC